MEIHLPMLYHNLSIQPLTALYKEILNTSEKLLSAISHLSTLSYSISLAKKISMPKKMTSLAPEVKCCSYC